MSKKTYSLETHRTVEHIIIHRDTLGFRIVVVKCTDKTMAEDILELLNKYQRPSVRKKKNRIDSSIIQKEEYDKTLMQALRGEKP